MRANRGLALAAVVLVVAAGVVAASLTLPTDAAVVNGTAIGRQTLNADLSAISASPAYQCYLYEQEHYATGTDPLPVSGAGAGSGTTPYGFSVAHPATYAGAFSVFWLDQLVEDEVLAQSNERRGVVITPYDLARARGVLELEMDHWIAQESPPNRFCLSSAEAVLDTLPASFVDRLVVRQANLFAFEMAGAGRRLGPGAVARYYGAHRAAFDDVCVYVLPVSSTTEAAQVAAQVKAGTPFGELAQANGGGEACDVPALDPGVAAAAKLPPGQVSSPIAAGEGSYVLLQRVSTRPTTLAAAVDEVVLAMVDAVGSKSAVLVARLQRDSHVWVDPRYGRWVPAPVFTIDPANSPPPSSLLCPAANEPGSSVVAVCPPPSHTTGAGKR